ncbi:ATP-binding protein [Caviibacter abscessus]|uniref:ATP-binding protein n=1 Tax=Caviibacter abscessus TaxID=1766719 RepID=UPI000AA441BF|nr:ATP-binding protein [Caviibacter abscessus]
MNAFREATINAFVHNKWINGNAPMFTIYSNRIEILSHGKLASNQTMEGFFLGESIPVNQKLSDIFLQLHISERSGKGVPKIIDTYGKDVFDFRENSIVVTIPFNWINNKVGDKMINKRLNLTRKTILKEIRITPTLRKNN